MRAIAIVTAALASACAAEVSIDPVLCLNDRGAELEPFDQLGYVAHAGGSPGGLSQIEPYTNSREAFEISYANGFRAFELDLVTLGDGTPIVAHDGHERLYGVDVEFRQAGFEDVRGARWRGKYDLLLIGDLVELLRDYPDVWIVLDTKWGDMEIAEAIVDEAGGDPALLDRVVPHLISDEHAAELAELYPFPERMIAIYQWPGSDRAIVDRMSRYGVDHVMMWWDSRWSEQTQATLEAAGLHVWVHTPEEPEVIEQFRDAGIGVYSNGHIDGCQEVVRASEL